MEHPPSEPEPDKFVRLFTSLPLEIRYLIYDAYLIAQNGLVFPDQPSSAVYFRFYKFFYGIGGLLKHRDVTKRQAELNRMSLAARFLTLLGSGASGKDYQNHGLQRMPLVNTAPAEVGNEAFLYYLSNKLFFSPTAGKDLAFALESLPPSIVSQIGRVYRGVERDFEIVDAQSYRPDDGLVTDGFGPGYCIRILENAKVIRLYSSFEVKDSETRIAIAEVLDDSMSSNPARKIFDGRDVVAAICSFDEAFGWDGLAACQSVFQPRVECSPLEIASIGVAALRCDEEWETRTCQNCLKQRKNLQDMRDAWMAEPKFEHVLWEARITG